MIALLLSPIYIIINIYVIRWLIRWMESCSKYFKNKISKIIIITIYTFFASSFIIGFLLPIRIIKVIGNYWLGVVQYIIITVILADLIRIILIKINKIDPKILHSRKVFAINGLICIIIVFIISTYGVFHADKIVSKNYDIIVDKEVPKLDTLKVSLVSDLHLGYNSTTYHITKMVNLINEFNPDIVIIAGDIFDNDYDAISNPDKIIKKLKKIESTYGTYAVFGNHDIDESILAGFTFTWKNNKGNSDKRMNQFLVDSNITLLQDNCLLIDNAINLCGRLDYHKLGMDIERRKTPIELLQDIDKDKPVIVIDHEPKELEELSLAGVDIDLSGHTHDGQMFPSNVFLHMFSKNPHGVIKVNDMTSVVTSGIGVYGPNMRVGTTAEVMNLNITFKK